MPKKSIRERILFRRKNLDDATCLAHSLSIQNRLLDTIEYSEAAAIALYSPIHNEVCTEAVLHAAHVSGKKVAYPRVRGDHLDFIEVDELSDLQPGAFGVLEPVGSTCVSASDLDMLVVPGVAFDLEGYRLGYGKGFYDRALHCGLSRGTLVGLCYEFQLVAELPIETHDIGMDLLITEERLFRF